MTVTPDSSLVTKMDAPSCVTATLDGNRPAGMARTTRAAPALMTETSSDPLLAGYTRLPSGAAPTPSGWGPTRTDRIDPPPPPPLTRSRLLPPSAGDAG